mmetsp:Transcript_37377/g.42721  ORF Transcript_37377/g.42721 Transcript_37377/m.42721 type:complete len:562 (+) Transcript_37377:59-1744(+)
MFDFRLGTSSLIIASICNMASILQPTTVAMAFSTTQQSTTSALLPKLRGQQDHRRIIGAAGELHFRSSASSKVSLNMMNVLNIPRGGGVVAAAAAETTAASITAKLTNTPSALFNSSLAGLALLTVLLKIAGSISKKTDSSVTDEESKKPESVKKLQVRFLAVFWLLRCADWLQGPYFYEVYASKIFNGAQASMSLVSRLFLTGFASTAIFGPLVGRTADTYGRKKGTLAFTVMYALGAMSTKSPILAVLLVGRILSGIGTSLLFSAPESWLVGESQKSGDDPDGKYLGETFGLAYAGDSIVAILAGQFAMAAAGRRGPTGPFELSTGFLAAGGLLAALLWKENKAEGSGGDAKQSSIGDAIKVVKADKKIMLAGAVQSLFEAAMYIFVLQWPPAITAAIAKTYGAGQATPYGAVFSCFMASCLCGSTIFGKLAKSLIPLETSTSIMLLIASIAMSIATFTVSSTMNLASLMASFFVFEACVGMYFPSIGTLRSKYVPDSHRSIIMNLFGIPLNILVVGVFLSIKQLGLKGALGISSASLSLAAICMMKLRSTVNKSDNKV